MHTATKISIHLCLLPLLLSCATSAALSGTSDEAPIPEGQCLLALPSIISAGGSYICESGSKGELDLRGLLVPDCKQCQRILFLEVGKSYVPEGLQLMKRALQGIERGAVILQRDGSSLPTEASRFWVRSDSVLLLKEGALFLLPDGHVIVWFADGDTVRASYVIY